MSTYGVQDRQTSPFNGLVTYYAITDQLVWQLSHEPDPQTIQRMQSLGMHWNPRGRSFSGDWTPTLEDVLTAQVAPVAQADAVASLRPDELTGLQTALDKQRRALKQLQDLNEHTDMSAEIHLMQRKITHLEQRLTSITKTTPRETMLRQATPAKVETNELTSPPPQLEVPPDALNQAFQEGQVIEVKLYGPCKILRIGENILHVEQLQNSPGTSRMIRRREVLAS